MLKILPWILAVALIAVAGWLFSANKKQTAQIEQLHQEREELHAAVEDANKTKAADEASELVRLRKENEDVLRLRNEVRQLRDEKTQLSKQLQTAQNQAQSSLTQARDAQAQALAARTNVAPLATNPALAGQQSAAEAEAFRKRYGLQPGAPTDPLSICVNNLRVLDGAKQQWALERAKPVNTLVAAPDIAPYLKDQAIPACPAGGAYSINAIGTPPTCSTAGHVLPK